MRQRFLPWTDGDFARRARAGLGAAPGAGKHRPRVALTRADHPIYLRPPAAARSLLSSMLGIGTTFVPLITAVGDATACSGTSSRGACMTSPTIAWPPSATETFVIFCSPRLRYRLSASI